MVRKHLLGIPIDCLNMDEAVTRLREMFLYGGKQYMVTTVNPEFVVNAQADPEFKAILKQADLSLPDGVGVQLAVGAPERLSGVDVLEHLFSLQGDALQAVRVFLLGGRGGVAEEAAEVLRERWSHVDVVGTYEGEAGAGDDLATREAILDRIQKAKGKRQNYPPERSMIDLLLVAFGHGKQEKWITRNLPHLPITVAMGVGGAFDYWSGRIPRAPKLLAALGLEWLFRLIVQPWRLKRQWKLSVFLWLLIAVSIKAQIAKLKNQSHLI